MHKKNILKKFLVLFSFIILLAFNTVSAVGLSSFEIPETSPTLDVSVVLTSTGISFYMLTESSEVPSKDDTRWIDSAPSTYSFSDEGSKTLYAWGKDAEENVSQSLSDIVNITLLEETTTDVTAPIVTSFTAPTVSTSLIVSISTLTATDATGVTGYLLAESATPPLSDDSGWVATPPTVYTFLTKGSKTLYAWAKDGNGNVSLSVSCLIEITLLEEAGSGGTTILKEHFIIKNGDIILYDKEVLFPEAGSIDIPDSSGVVHSVNKQSVLGLLYFVDQEDNTFSISDLSYSDSMESFLLNCIKPDISEPLCYNWQYVVNGSYPSVSMDKTFLKGGDNIYIFFGQPNKIILSSDSIDTSESIVVTAKKYDYKNNTWINSSGESIAVIQDNPNDIYNPIEIQSGVTGENGNKIFDSLSDGLYSAGLKVEGVWGDYYWPTEKFTVIKYIPSTSGSGVSHTPSPEKTFSVENALSFLSTQQNTDGSYDFPMYTDWAAIAAKAGNNERIKSSILNYLKSNPVSSNVVTDYERRAMALMALGVNPYNGTDIDYIKKITSSFDGKQIGDTALYNDDIFGIIVLSNAGFTKNDEIIKNTISYIISNQSSNGSWGSVDMTGAAIQSLNNFKSLSGVSSAISKGELYLKEEQKIDGSFGNVSSTSWAIQALSLNSSYNTEVDKAIKYLTTQQHTDGGLDFGNTKDNRIWSTSYSVPAILKLSWSDILDLFSKEEIESASNDIEVEVKNTPQIEIQKPELIIEEKAEIKISVVEKNTVDIPVKIIKKEKNIKNNNTAKIFKEKEPSGNLLMASAVNYDDTNNRSFMTLLSRVVGTLKAPFVWLYLHTYIFIVSL